MRTRQEERRGGADMGGGSGVAGTRSPALWFGVVGPPAAWATHLVLGDLIFELGCGPAVGGRDILLLPLRTWALIETAVLAAVATLAGLVALGAWRRLRVIQDGPRIERAGAMALAGMASSVGYGLIIVFGFLPSVWLRPCLPSL